MSAAGYRSARARCARAPARSPPGSAASQHVKPENLMPSFDMLPAEEIGAIAAYLESLR